MTWCIKNEQKKKHFLTLDQKRAKENKKDLLKTINNSNKNAEVVSLRFPCKKGVPEIFMIFNRKHL